MKRFVPALLVLIAVVAWAVWSYKSGGLVSVLVSDPPPGATRVSAVREYVIGFGVLAPIVYLCAVTVEVLIAPIPGTLLYAPAGVIFGGFVGGTLSLIGNVVGAMIACWIAGRFGERWRTRPGVMRRLAPYRDRLVARGAWIVFLLRINPLTSSDLVSYAAGLAGMPVRQVALGTLAAMAPLCYLQAYLAASLFEWLFERPIAIVTVVAVAVIGLVILLRRGTKVPRYE